MKGRRGTREDSSWSDYPGDEDEWGGPETGSHDPYGDDDDDDYGREFGTAGQLVPYGSSEMLPAELPLAEQPAPVIIAGTGVSMGDPFIKRRERPLAMRITVITLMVSILVTGIFTVTPLTSSANSGSTPFSALAGTVVFNSDQSGYHWYVSQPGDEFETIAQKFNVQVGGIFEMNHITAGQDLAVGVAYKIPDDPNFGADYVPPQPPRQQTGNATVFGNEWWDSYAGDPLPETACAPNGNGNPLGYQLQSPNWHSSWVRGFSSFHNGIDLAAPYGNPIHAAQSGQIIWAGYDATNGLGWSVVINHCNHLSTVYGHMSKILVKAGDQVVKGDVVGLEGMTGWATGPHLHFMVQTNNYAVDPMAYFTGIGATENP